MIVMKKSIAVPSPQPASDDGLRWNSRGLTGEPAMLMGMWARMVMMQMPMGMRRKNHRKSMMDQRRLWRTVLGPIDVDRYEGEDGDDADADEKEEASQAKNGSMQNVED
jgi:hypothetical protein